MDPGTELLRDGPQSVARHGFEKTEIGLAYLDFSDFLMDL